MKKVVSLLLCLVMLLGLFGCAGGSGVRDGAAQLTGEVIVIKLQLNGLKEQWMANAAEEFTYRTGIQVQYEFDSMLNGSMQTLFDTPDLITADLYFVQMNEWAKWAEAGHLRDITLMMNEKNENDKSLKDRIVGNDFYLLDGGEEVNYIVPLTYAPTALAYNKPMMDYLCHDMLGWEDGHDYPINTKELKEVFAALQQATANDTNNDLFTYTQSGKTYDVQPMVWSGSTGYLEMMVYPWIYQYLGVDGTEAYYNQTNDLKMLGHDAFYYAYQEMMDLLDLELTADGEWTSASSVPGCPSFNHVTSQQRFVRSQALIVPTGSWFYTETSDLINELDMGDKLGFMPVPWMSDDEGNYMIADGATPAKDENGNYTAISRMNNVDYFLIPTEAQCPELAEEFLKFLFSEDYLPKLCEDLQSPMCFELDDSKVEKTPWFAEVDKVMDQITPAEIWSPNKLYYYGRVGIYYNPGNAPFARLVQSSFGSSAKWIDSATGLEIAKREDATGVAVTENVYLYLQGNYREAQQYLRDSKKELGV